MRAFGFGLHGTAHRRCPQGVTNVFEQPSLAALSLSALSYTIGTAASGAITGATAGSTIAATGLPSGLTINGPARTWAWSGSGSAGSSTITLTETLADSANSPRASSVGVTVASASAAAEVWLTWGDSIGVGIYARAAGTDLDWPKVYQVRQRATAGISADNSPLDQGIAPTGTDYLSPSEYFAKQRAADTGRDIYLVPHNWNGTRVAGSGATWGVGTTLENAFIARANAAIQLVQGSVAGAIVGGIIQFIGSNEIGQSVSAATFDTALSAAITDMRGGIFKNGVSGATIADLPYIMVGIAPEYVGGNPTAGNPIQYKLQQLAAALAGGRYFLPGEGITGDNLHFSLAGNPSVGAALAGLLTDATAPTITTAATFGVYEAQPLLLELAASEYVYWSLSGADAGRFEIVPVTDSTNAGAVSSARTRWYLRWLGDGTKTFASPNDADGDNVYQVTLNARDGAGTLTTKALAVTVAQAYGQVGAVTYGVAPQAYTGAPTGQNLDQVTGVQLGAGMNIISLRKNSGSPSITGLTVDGITATRHPSSTTELHLFYVPIASARTATLKLVLSAVGATDVALTVATLTGTAAAPTELVLQAGGTAASPHQVAVTTPTNGISVAGGVSVTGPIAPVGGAAFGLSALPYWNVYRTTAGNLGVTAGGSSYRWVIASSWAKA